MNIKALFLSKDKKKELEKELERLVKEDRVKISERLAEAREVARGEDQEDLIMVIEEKHQLEDRINEIRDILLRSKVTKEECKIAADVGSEIVLAHDKNVRIFKLVSPVEVDPSKNRISLESEMGKKLKGLKMGDKVKLNNEDGTELEYRVMYLC
ncbi:MAG: GreA/GreB family elongation factor [Candidatus Dojkabacteria bacterium]|nr:GreA/GreB family elongation factor [Candidatus Dojkabacteria bacterium]